MFFEAYLVLGKGAINMKKLIIVCEEKLHRYGDFLAQLISGNDDKEGIIVGIKDGTAAAQVWTEKDYASNAAQISSEQYLLFIGNTKLIKEKRHHMQKRYSQFGMNYGWLGKQAVLFVDRTLSFSEYETFFQLATGKYAESNQPELARLLPARHGSADEEGPLISVELSEDESVIDAEENEAQAKRSLERILVPFKAAGVAIKKGAEHSRESFSRMSDNINAASKSKEIEEHQYTRLVLLFYLNVLGKFLGVCEG